MVLVVGLGLLMAVNAEAVSINQSVNNFYIAVTGTSTGAQPAPVTLANFGQSTSGLTTISSVLDLAGNGVNTLIDPKLFLSFTDLDVMGQLIGPYFLRESVVLTVNGTQVWNSSMLPSGSSNNISGIEVDLGFLNGQSVASLNLQFQFTGQLTYYGRSGNTTKSFINTPESLGVTFQSGDEIPEPTTVALLGAGAVALASRRRRHAA
jgi:hypothetical protein